MKKPYHIYFICTGNACRSPLAECIMQKLLEQTDLVTNGCLSESCHHH
nr:MAG TPA: LMWPAP protein [Caudoviricetes sp.]